MEALQIFLAQIVQLAGDWNEMEIEKNKMNISAMCRRRHASLP